MKNQTNIDPIVTVEITEREWKVVQVLRQIRYGKMTIQKIAGAITIIEPQPTLKVDEIQNTSLEIDVE